MSKNTFPSFNIPTYFKLVFAAILCLATLCSCGGGGGNARDVKVIEVTPPETPPSGPPSIIWPIIPIDFNDTDLERQIRQDYLDVLHSSDIPFERDKTIDDVSVVAYYGNYNGSVPVMMRVYGRGYIGVDRCRVIADIEFAVSGNFITVWKDGQFYSLEEAYNLGFLTQEDLRDIADLHNGPNNPNLYICHLNDE